MTLSQRKAIRQHFETGPGTQTQIDKVSVCTLSTGEVKLVIKGTPIRVHGYLVRDLRREPGLGMGMFQEPFKTTAIINRRGKVIASNYIEPK